jgi:hypothetical protein
MSDITITNLGRIVQLVANLPPDGGIGVFRGKQGCGKSTALAAVDALTTGTKLTNLSGQDYRPRDGINEGTVVAHGLADGEVRVTLRKSTTRSGALEVATLESKVNAIADAIDPHVKNELSADARRFKALVGIAGKDADLSVYYDLVGGRERLEQIICQQTLDTTCPVQQSARIKRDLERAAGHEERQAATLKGQATLCRQQADVPTDVETDAEKLQAAHALTVSDLNRVQDRIQQYTEAARKADLAGKVLLEAELAYEGPTVPEAIITEGIWRTQTEEADEKITQLRTQLAEAEAAKADYAHRWSQAKHFVKAAEHHERLIATNRATINSLADVENPSPEDLQQAKDRVDDALAAIRAGDAARQAKKFLAEASEHSDNADAHSRFAVRYREAAKEADNILAKFLPAGPLRAEAGRVVLKTDRGPSTNFAELSEGERTKLVVEHYVVPVIGEGGLFTLSQEGWQGLQPKNRDLLARLCVHYRVNMLTAEVDDGELRYEIYDVKSWPVEDVKQIEAS